MKDKNNFGLRVCHLALLTIAIFMNVSMIVLRIATHDTFVGDILVISISVLNIFALLAGFIYLQKNYSKPATILYKAFLLLTAASNLLLIANLIVLYISRESLDTYDIIPIMFIASITIMVIKFISLLIMAFGKDLGRGRTWTLFSIIFVIDLVYGTLFQSLETLNFYQVVFILSRLLLDGTIGLSIVGKYTTRGE